MSARRFSIGRLARGGALLLSACLVFHGCDDESVEVDDERTGCGPCGEVTMGEATITGDARLDGFFKAVGTLGSAAATIESEFRVQVAELAAIFEVDIEGMALGDAVAAVKAEIEAEIDANVSGALRVKYAGPECSADLSVAVEAQANCEAKAGCDVSAECSDGAVAVQCDGACSGGCSGICEGACTVDATGTCEGICEGSCYMEPSPGVCEGTCNGTCSGSCSLQDSEGNCKGQCTGDCSGVCEPPSAGMICAGECHGACSVEAVGACEGECYGACDAECSGGCEGNAIPPSCSAESSCEASADCQSSASAQASASLHCYPPSIELDFDFETGVSISDQAAFLARMKAFEVQMVAVVQGMVTLRALADASYSAEIGIESPVSALQVQLETLTEANLDTFDIPKGRIPCLLPALEDSISILGSVSADAAAVIQGQLSLFAIIG